MPRVLCTNCQRPEKVCVCAFITVQTAQYPVLVLQHPDEKRKPLSTVPILEKSLTQITVKSDTVFDEEQCIAALGAMGGQQPLLVYPNSASQTQTLWLDYQAERKVAGCNRFEHCDALILLDGTWRNTREIMLINDWLCALPTLALRNTPPSRYRIRKATQADALSTIETVAFLMGLLDETFCADQLLRPFDEMVERQIASMGRAVFERNYTDADKN